MPTREGAYELLAHPLSRSDADRIAGLVKTVVGGDTVVEIIRREEFQVEALLAGTRYPVHPVLESRG